MHDGTLYPERGVGGAYNVDVKIDDENFDKICEAELGSTVMVEATAVKGHTGNTRQIFIKREYVQFFTDGATLDDVKIKVHAQPTATGSGGDGNLYPENVKITIQGIRNEV